MSKRSIPIEKKLEIINAYNDGDYSIKEIIAHYKVAESTLREWLYKLEHYGIESLQESKSWKNYSKEVKLAAIQDYLSGEYSKSEIARKYEISSRDLLNRWIRNYNGHREIRGTAKGMKDSMTKGRSTTFEERIDIVSYCLANAKDYHKTSEMYKVSYQQVYQWVRKYEDGGEEALKDQRGRKKAEAELSPEEKLNLQMKKLERENERLRAENLFLKKLEEIERRRK